MRGRVNYNRLVEQLQRDLAPQPSDKKDPSIMAKDTLVVKDTVVLPPVAITDTVTTKLHDTIVVEKDRLKVRIVKRQDTYYRREMRLGYDNQDD